MYKDSYEVPPRPKLNLKPSVKTQTMASDIKPPEDDSPREKGTGAIDIDFDPFESEEEFIIEESE